MSKEIQLEIIDNALNGEDGQPLLIKTRCSVENFDSLAAILRDGLIPDEMLDYV